MSTIWSGVEENFRESPLAQWALTTVFAEWGPHDSEASWTLETSRAQAQVQTF